MQLMLSTTPFLMLKIGLLATCATGGSEKCPPPLSGDGDGRGG